jgi:hypothetical protein
MTKRIIQRNLSLQQKYTLISSNYLPLLDGGGTCCANCGTIIANIATVKGDDGKTYDIGHDCLETFLINNQLLDGKSVEHYEKVVKKCLGKVKKVRQEMRDFLTKNPFIDEVHVIHEQFMPEWITFHYFANDKCKWNDNTKAKVMDFELLMASLKTLEQIKSVTFKLIKK